MESILHLGKGKKLNFFERPLQGYWRKGIFLNVKRKVTSCVFPKMVHHCEYEPDISTNEANGKASSGDPWSTIHFRGQTNHVGTSHIPLGSNFNHIFIITPITSDHIILTYPLQGSLDEEHSSYYLTSCKHFFSDSVLSFVKRYNIHLLFILIVYDLLKQKK